MTESGTSGIGGVVAEKGENPRNNLKEIVVETTGIGSEKKQQSTRNSHVCVPTIPRQPVEIEFINRTRMDNDLVTNGRQWNISERTIKDRHMVESIWSDINVENCSEKKSVTKIQSDDDETSLKLTTKIHLMMKKRRKNSPMMITKKRMKKIR
ncbi:hypothetical protein DPMN_107987 [Dreissena polymorpha]|uniref:Uncharacterized protein n=1 Tax=Dreissena polymorpha TaxID=45954 RepID=A0A9D4K813_DREPO|nr:hypothetical protein DPMN_107987 [Dreissena polymorpha]